MRKNQNAPNQQQMVLQGENNIDVNEDKIIRGAEGEADERAMAFSQTSETEQNSDVLFSFYDLKICKHFHLLMGGAGGEMECLELFHGMAVLEIALTFWQPHIFPSEKFTLLLYAWHMILIDNSSWKIFSKKQTNSFPLVILSWEMWCPVWSFMHLCMRCTNVLTNFCIFV